jgi:5-formyltetrahydrofolate cyclo-ligase
MITIYSGGSMDKKTLRAVIREKKRAMTEKQILDASRQLLELFINHPLYQQAGTIYGYLPYNQEVRTVPILEQAIKDGKRVAVPKVFGDEMKFIYVDDLTKVDKGYCRIPEPIFDEPVADDKTAVVLMPGLAFDHEGHRIGYGGGFYDRFLAAEPDHPTIALCYDFQMVDCLETEEFDVPVDCVLWAKSELIL